MSSATTVSIIPKYLPHHHPHLICHLLWRCHCSPNFIFIVSFISATLFIVWFHHFDPLLFPPPPCATDVIQIIMCSDFLDRIFSSLWVFLHYIALSALLYTTYITLRSDILTTLLSYLLALIFYLSPQYYCYTPIWCVFLHSPSLRSAPILLISV